MLRIDGQDGLADGQGKAASMGDVSGQAPAFGHVREAAQGIEGLEVSVAALRACETRLLTISC